MQTGTFQQFMLVGFGGAMGSMLRYAGNLLYAPKLFPLTTLLINLLGSLIMGMVMAWSLRQPSSDNWKLLIATGLCGGFTTFSAFSYENLCLLQAGKPILSILYVAGSVAGGIVAAWLGYRCLQ